MFPTEEHLHHIVLNFRALQTLYFFFFFYLNFNEQPVHSAGTENVTKETPEHYVHL